MIVGCTGMILLTGTLIQFLTINQLQHIFGFKRMKAEVDKLEGHVIVVGFGRVGPEVLIKRPDQHAFLARARARL